MREAVEALVRRDAGALAAMTRHAREDPRVHWEWTREYAGGIELVLPPGPFEDWELEATAQDGALRVHLELWAAGEDEPIDAAMELTLHGDDAGGTHVRLDGVHPLSPPAVRVRVRVAFRVGCAILWSAHSSWSSPTPSPAT